MTDARRADARPWIVAAALGAVAIALGAVVLFVIHPDRSDKQKLGRATGLTALQQQAMDAGRTEALNLTTYSRKAFAADYARALSGATGDLAKDLNSTPKRDQLLANMNSGKFDLSGQVVNTALEAQAGDQFSVLVLTLGYKVPDTGPKVQSSRSRFEMTIVRQGGKWLVSSLKDIGTI